jgi:hypothetical protein
MRSLKYKPFLLYLSYGSECWTLTKEKIIIQMAESKWSQDGVTGNNDNEDIRKEMGKTDVNT